MADDGRSADRLLLLCGGAIRPPIAGGGTEDEPGILERFQRRHPGVTVEVSYGASNLLLGQLKLTGRGDLFLPGDDFYVEQARSEGLVYETRTVARFVPVILVARDNPLAIETVADLAGPDVRLAVADPRAAAIGRITPEIFRRNGVDYSKLDNIVFTGITAPEVAQAVALGHADATITWRPTARQHERHCAMIDIEPEKNVFSPLVIAVLATSRNKEAALAFATFLSGPEGRDTFERHDYEVK